MTKGEAVCAIVADARSVRSPTNTSIKRIVKSLNVLELSDADVLLVLSNLDIARHDTGEPYGKDRGIMRIWK